MLGQIEGVPGGLGDLVTKNIKKRKKFHFKANRINALTRQSLVVLKRIEENIPNFSMLIVGLLLSLSWSLNYNAPPEAMQAGFGFSTISMWWQSVTQHGVFGDSMADKIPIIFGGIAVGVKEVLSKVLTKKSEDPKAKADAYIKRIEEFLFLMKESLFPDAVEASEDLIKKVAELKDARFIPYLLELMQATSLEVAEEARQALFKLKVLLDIDIPDIPERNFLAEPDPKDIRKRKKILKQGHIAFVDYRTGEVLEIWEGDIDEEFYKSLDDLLGEYKWIVVEGVAIPSGGRKGFHLGDGIASIRSTPGEKMRILVQRTEYRNVIRFASRCNFPDNDKNRMYDEEDIYGEIFDEEGNLKKTYSKMDRTPKSDDVQIKIGISPNKKGYFHYKNERYWTHFKDEKLLLWVKDGYPIMALPISSVLDLEAENFEFKTIYLERDKDKFLGSFSYRAQPMEEVLIDVDEGNLVRVESLKVLEGRGEIIFNNEGYFVDSKKFPAGTKTVAWFIKIKEEEDGDIKEKFYLLRYAKLDDYRKDKKDCKIYKWLYDENGNLMLTYHDDMPGFSQILEITDGNVYIENMQTTADGRLCYRKIPGERGRSRYYLGWRFKEEKVVLWTKKGIPWVVMFLRDWQFANLDTKVFILGQDDIGRIKPKRFTLEELQQSKDTLHNKIAQMMEDRFKTNRSKLRDLLFDSNGLMRQGLSERSLVDFIDIVLYSRLHKEDYDIQNFARLSARRIVEHYKRDIINLIEFYSYNHPELTVSELNTIISTLSQKIKDEYDFSYYYEDKNHLKRYIVLEAESVIIDYVLRNRGEAFPREKSGLRARFKNVVRSLVSMNGRGNDGTLSPSTFLARALEVYPVNGNGDNGSRKLKVSSVAKAGVIALGMLAFFALPEVVDFNPETISMLQQSVTQHGVSSGSLWMIPGVLGFGMGMKMVNKDEKLDKISDVDALRASGQSQRVPIRLSPILKRLSQLLAPYYLLLYLLSGHTTIPNVIKRIKAMPKKALRTIENLMKNSEASIAAKRMLHRFKHILKIPSRLPSVNSIADYLSFKNLSYTRAAVKRISIAGAEQMKAGVAVLLALPLIINNWEAISMLQQSVTQYGVYDGSLWMIPGVFGLWKPAKNPLPITKHNLWLPGEIVSLEVNQLEPVNKDVTQETRKFKVAAWELGSGFAGEGWKLEILDNNGDGTGEYVLFKAYKPGLLKRLIRDLQRGIHPAWREKEVKMGILVRDILAKISRVEGAEDIYRDYSELKEKAKGTALVIGSWQGRYAFSEEFGAWGSFVEFYDARGPNFGIFTKARDKEMMLWASITRRLGDFLRKRGFIGTQVQALAGKTLTGRTEPASLGHLITAIVLLGGSTVLALNWLVNYIFGVWALPFIHAPPIYAFTAFIGFYFLLFTSGASWFSLDNVKMSNSDGLLRLQDTDVGLSHTTIIWPVALTFNLGILVLAWLFSFNLLLTVFLMVLVSPSWFHPFEFSYFRKNLKEGYPVASKKVLTNTLKKHLADKEEVYSEALDEEEYTDFKAQVVWLEELQNQLESETFEPVNRFSRMIINLFRKEKIEAPRFSLSKILKAMRQENISWWQLNDRITEAQANKIKGSFMKYIFAFVILRIPFMGKFYNPENREKFVRFVFTDIVYRKARWNQYKEEHLLEMVKRERINDIERGNISFIMHLFLSKITPEKLQLFIADKEYRRDKLIELCKAVSLNRGYLLEVAERKYDEYLEKERDKGLEDSLYEKLQDLKRKGQAQGYAFLWSLFWKSKPLLYILSLSTLGTGVLLTGGTDLLPWLPGWAWGIIGFFGIKGLYRVVIASAIAYIFKFRFLEGLMVAGLAFLPFGSYYAVPLTARVFSEDWQEFFILFGLKWKSFVRSLTSFMPGYGEEGNLLHYYSNKTLVDVPLAILKFIFSTVFGLSDKVKYKTSFKEEFLEGQVTYLLSMFKLDPAVLSNPENTRDSDNDIIMDSDVVPDCWSKLSSISKNLLNLSKSIGPLCDSISLVSFYIIWKNIQEINKGNINKIKTIRGRSTADGFRHHWVEVEFFGIEGWFVIDLSTFIKSYSQRGYYIGRQTNLKRINFPEEEFDYREGITQEGYEVKAIDETRPQDKDDDPFGGELLAHGRDGSSAVRQMHRSNMNAKISPIDVSRNPRQAKEAFNNFLRIMRESTREELGKYIRTFEIYLLSTPSGSITVSPYAKEPFSFNVLPDTFYKITSRYDYFLDKYVLVFEALGESESIHKAKKVVVFISKDSIKDGSKRGFNSFKGATYEEALASAYLERFHWLKWLEREGKSDEFSSRRKCFNIILTSSSETEYIGFTCSELSSARVNMPQRLIPDTQYSVTSPVIDGYLEDILVLSAIDAQDTVICEIVEKPEAGGSKTANIIGRGKTLQEAIESSLVFLKKFYIAHWNKDAGLLEHYGRYVDQVFKCPGSGRIKLSPERNRNVVFEGLEPGVTYRVTAQILEPFGYWVLIFEAVSEYLEDRYIIYEMAPQPEKHKESYPSILGRGKTMGEALGRKLLAKLYLLRWNSKEESHLFKESFSARLLIPSAKTTSINPYAVLSPLPEGIKMPGFDNDIKVIFKTDYFKEGVMYDLSVVHMDGPGEDVLVFQAQESDKINLDGKPSVLVFGLISQPFQPTASPLLGKGNTLSEALEDSEDAVQVRYNWFERIDMDNDLIFRVLFANKRGEIAERFRELRRAKGYSQTSLAKESGASQSAVNTVERGNAKNLANMFSKYIRQLPELRNIAEELFNETAEELIEKIEQASYLGFVFRDIREWLGLSRKEMSRLVGVSEAALKKIERRVMWPDKGMWESIESNLPSCIVNNFDINEILFENLISIEKIGEIVNKLRRWNKLEPDAAAERAQIDSEAFLQVEKGKDLSVGMLVKISAVFALLKRILEEKGIIEADKQTAPKGEVKFADITSILEEALNEIYGRDNWVLLTRGSINSLMVDGKVYWDCVDKIEAIVFARFDAILRATNQMSILRNIFKDKGINLKGEDNLYIQVAEDRYVYFDFSEAELCNIVQWYNPFDYIYGPEELVAKTKRDIHGGLAQQNILEAIVSYYERICAHYFDKNSTRILYTNPTWMISGLTQLCRLLGREKRRIRYIKVIQAIITKGSEIEEGLSRERFFRRRLTKAFKEIIEKLNFSGDNKAVLKSELNHNLQSLNGLSSVRQVQAARTSI